MPNAILTETLACFLPGQAKDLPALLQMCRDTNSRPLVSFYGVTADLHDGRNCSTAPTAVYMCRPRTVPITHMCYLRPYVQCNCQSADFQGIRVCATTLRNELPTEFVTHVELYSSRHQATDRHQTDGADLVSTYGLLCTIAVTTPSLCCRTRRA